MSREVFNITQHFFHKFAPMHQILLQLPPQVIALTEETEGYSEDLNALMELEMLIIKFLKYE